MKLIKTISSLLCLALASTTLAQDNNDALLPSLTENCTTKLIKASVDLQSLSLQIAIENRLNAEPTNIEIQSIGRAHREETLTVLTEKYESALKDFDYNCLPRFSHCSQPIHGFLRASNNGLLVLRSLEAIEKQYSRTESAVSQKTFENQKHTLNRQLRDSLNQSLLAVKSCFKSQQ